MHLALLLPALLSFWSDEPPAVTISISHTACYGACPVYSISVDGSGVIIYRGAANVATIGDRGSTIPKDQVEALMQRLDDIHFFALRDAYTRAVTDLPSTYISVSRDGKTKRIRDCLGAPRELKDTERLIEQVLNVHQWIHDQHGARTLESGPPVSHWLDDLKDRFVLAADAAGGIKSGTTELMRAAATEAGLPRIRSILRSGINVNAMDETGWTALMIAAGLGQPESVSALLAAGARINASDSHGDTALIAAAANSGLGYQSGYEEVVRRLLAAGAPVNGANYLKETPLMWAAMAGNMDVFWTLLKASADPKRQDVTGKTAETYVRQRLTSLHDPALQEPFQVILSQLTKQAKN